MIVDPQIVTIVIAIAGSAGAVLAFVAGRRERAAVVFQQEASAAASLSESYMNLVKSLQLRLDKIEEDYKEADINYRALRKENEILCEELEELREDKKELQQRIGYLEDRLEKIDEDLTNGGYNS